MQIMTPQNRTDTLVEELTSVWRASVEATHDFLSEQDVERIAQYVPEAIRAVRVLVTACDDNSLRQLKHRAALLILQLEVRVPSVLDARLLPRE